MSLISNIHLSLASKLLLGLLLVFVAAGSLTARPAAAADLLGNPVSCTSLSTTAIKDDSLKQVCTKYGPVIGVLLIFINFLAAGVGIVVAGGIVWGGINYAQSNGNAQKAQQGITYIVNSVIGLILFIFMWALLQFLIPGGVLNS